MNGPIISRVSSSAISSSKRLMRFAGNALLADFHHDWNGQRRNLVQILMDDMAFDSAQHIG